MKKELTTKERDQVATLQAKKDQLEKEAKDLSKEITKLDNERRKIHSSVNDIVEEIFDLTSPFTVGDIVEDEVGVRYRITKLGYGPGPTRLVGIRLSKNGSEAFKDPRTIWAKQLRKVE